MLRLRSVALIFSALGWALAAQGQTPGRKAGLTVDDMLAMQRISAHAVSPDGQWVAFTVRDTDLAANRGRTDVWLARTDGKEVRRLTTHPDGDSDPRFSRDGAWVYFLSSRSGSSQVWRIRPAGGEAEQVTKLALDVNGFNLFPDGQRLLLAIEVYPDLAGLERTSAKDAEKEKDPVKALAFETLLFRHWDQWEDGKRSHLFVARIGQDSAPIDLMKGMDTDAPTHPWGGFEEVAISPDSKTVVFAAREEGKKAAWTANVDLYHVGSDGSAKPQRLTADNLALDNVPAFSPDGRTLAYLATVRPGYESDRNRIVLLDWGTKKRKVLTEAWDRSPASIAWSADGKTLTTSADHLGGHALFAIDVASQVVRPLIEKGTNKDPQPAADRWVFVRDTLVSPAELYTVRPDGSELQAITRLNADRVAQIAWGEYEQFSFPGAKRDTVHGYAMKPAGFTGGKAPIAFLIHGGPQGSFGDHFHYRWNPQVFAGHGYAVVFIDFHGSTGYGQAFTDAIRGDWGGAPYEDLMLGLDYAEKKYPWLDGKRATALGASYGGFMVNWINGHTDRFKALVCHDGNLDERMAYFDTEELWFPEWEHGGTPWDSPEDYLKSSPVAHVKSWKTPTLVIHGARDFRVVDTHGMGTFTALQRRGIPSRFLWFPDENHWVLKPQNSRRWHQEVLAWLDRWTKKK